MITTEEKLEMLRDAIHQLYSKEGRSFTYIAKLLDVNRTKLTRFIKSNNFEEPVPKSHLNPSNQKFVNKNREYIKSQLDADVDVKIIAENLGVSDNYLYSTIIKNDAILKQASYEKNNRLHKRHEDRKKEHMQNAKWNYIFEDLEGEEWKEIDGYEGYFVSNKGRVKKYIKRYDAYCLLTPQPNKNNNRLYVSVIDNNEKRHNLQIARLVGYNFVKGHSAEKNTINHIDGDVSNNKSDNLEWASQAENNSHAYQSLNRTKVNFKRYKFDRILYMGKYEFKTVAAFARFLGKSETQTRRYLDYPEKHNIELIINCND